MCCVVRYRISIVQNRNRSDTSCPQENNRSTYVRTRFRYFDTRVHDTSILSFSVITETRRGCQGVAEVECRGKTRSIRYPTLICVTTLPSSPILTYRWVYTVGIISVSILPSNTHRARTTFKPTCACGHSTHIQKRNLVCTWFCDGTYPWYTPVQFSDFWRGYGITGGGKITGHL